MPLVGRVIDVAPEVLNVTVSVFDPMIVLPDTVIVFPVFATPVPPYCPAITPAFQVPLVRVPTLVSEEPVTPEPKVVELRTLVPAI